MDVWWMLVSKQKEAERAGVVDMAAETMHWMAGVDELWMGLMCLASQFEERFSHRCCCLLVPF